MEVKMSKINSKFWLFGKQNEPADDFDADYDPIYYGEKPVEENDDNAGYTDYAQDDISEVKVVTEEPEVEEEEEVEEEVEEVIEEPLYKVIFAP